jgi:predicted TIM-barrel fold metal-dependent hydrolase
MRGSRPVRVDGHLHLFEAVSEKYPREVHPLFPAELSAPVEDFIEVMDDNGIDCAVIVPLSHHDEYLEYCLSTYPKRLRGIGIYNPEADDPAGDFRKRRRRSGISGLRVFDLRAGGEEKVEDIRELKIYSLLEAMEDEGSILWYYWSEEQIPLLEDVLKDFPELTVAMNHLGFTQAGFEVDELGRPQVKSKVPPSSLPVLLENGKKYKNLYVMFSGEYALSEEEFPFLDFKPVVEQIYSVFGAERMFWASDYPWVVEKPGYGRQLELVDVYLPDIPETERDMIMGKTAARLFGFPQIV